MEGETPAPLASLSKYGKVALPLLKHLNDAVHKLCIVYLLRISTSVCLSVTDSVSFES